MPRASVDLETDSKIQHTIKTEFRDRTLLCIARAYYFHCRGSTVDGEWEIADRLRTIISYDRVLVMDGGVVAVSARSRGLSGKLNCFRNLIRRIICIRRKEVFSGGCARGATSRSRTLK